VVGAALLMLALAGCSGAVTNIESEPPDTQVTTTAPDLEPVIPPAPQASSTTVAAQPEPTTTTTSTTTTTVVEPVEEPGDTVGNGSTLAEFTTDELDDLLSDLDQILGDLDFSFAQEEGEIFNE
jgi:hypothetical protein